MRFKLDSLAGPRSSKSRVSVDEEYKFVSSQVKEHNARIMEAFKLYIQLITLVVGGSSYLSIMPNGPSSARLQQFATLADALVAFITLIALLMVAENLRGWFGYRMAQSRLAGLDISGNPHIPRPRRFRASVLEGALMLAMIVAAAGFHVFNPLRMT